MQDAPLAASSEEVTCYPDLDVRGVTHIPALISQLEHIDVTLLFHLSLFYLRFLQFLDVAIYLHVDLLVLSSYCQPHCQEHFIRQF